jgi:hypothetical protein
MSGYQGFRPRYDSYRDERRDPRIHPADSDRRHSTGSTDGSYTPSPTTSKEMPNQSSNDIDVNERRSGLKEIQNEQYSTGESLTGTSIMQISAKQSIVKTPEKTSMSRKLIVGNDISDPFTCNLTADDGKRCIREFSGVDRYSDRADK